MQRTLKVGFAALSLALLGLTGAVRRGELLGAPGEVGRAGTPSSADSAAPRRGLAATLGEGFVVWESNRSDRWRLWRRELDGSELRQLSFEEGERLHCCAHISPDGQRIAYQRFLPGQLATGAAAAVATLHLMNADGSGDRPLADPVRLLSERRSAVWLDSERLLFVDAEGHTQLLTIPADGSLPSSRRRITRRPHPRDGWLMNRSMTHATTAWVTFSPYDADTLDIAERRQYGGCQPYFSHDGRWGFWMGGAGGPIRRIDLASREVATVLGKNDARLPREQGYLYFPMLSRDGRLLAFGASPNEHDFRFSNYDIFVVEVDDERFELVGDPVRFTSDPATDRFPDVFAAPLALGRHDGEVPLSVELASPSMGGLWRWDFGDGTRHRSAHGRHTYRRSGDFEVEARRGAETLRGAVRVREAQPPQPLSVEVRHGRRVRVVFDEPIDLRQARLRVETATGGALVSGPVEAIAPRGLEIELERPIADPVVLHIEGVSDRAQRPNLLAAVAIPIEPPRWPSRRQGLVFLWETGDQPNLIFDPAAEIHRSFALTPDGRSRLDRHFGMLIDRGSFEAGPEAGDYTARRLAASNRLTLELTLRPASRRSKAPIVAFGGAGPRQLNFILEQGGEALRLRLREGAAQLLTLPGSEEGLHLVVTYTPGELRAYLNGEEVLSSEALQGDLSQLKAGRLAFGSQGWGGGIEGVAIYDRVLAGDEVAENARRYLEKVAARTPVPRRQLEATLRQTSAVPTLEEIAPYREALVVFEYRHRGERLRVVHWALLGGEGQAAAERRPGQSYPLLLEPFASHPELEGLYLRDELPPRAEAELYVDLSRLP